jgi:hypothetical protein
MTDKIVEDVIQLFQQRSATGIKKYGTTLEQNNTDDFIQHLQEELMDAILYLQKIKDTRNSEIPNLSGGCFYKNDNGDLIEIILKSGASKEK